MWCPACLSVGHIGSIRRFIAAVIDLRDFSADGGWPVARSGNYVPVLFVHDKNGEMK